jgi:hypothetical protein
LEEADILDLALLERGLPGVSSTWGGFLAEASAVCLEHHDHPRGVQLRVRGLFKTSIPVHWSTTVTEQVLASWGDEQELVEYGACGVAILVILKFAAHKVIRRARKGTHVDYWLADANSTLPFQEAARLEISGILDGSDANVARRVREKTNQVNQTVSALSAYVVVVEFSTPQSHVVQT